MAEITDEPDQGRRGEPDISTLVKDIDRLFTEGIKISDDDADQLGRSIAAIIQSRLDPDERANRSSSLRMSNLGKPSRQLWYDLKSDLPKEELPANTLRKFMFGDVWEAILLSMARLAGHEVTLEQAEVEVDGVVGHIDAVIDGVVVDVKSASSYAFKKFKDGSLVDNDPFGYYDQLAGYSEALNLPGAWLAVNKETGSLALLEVSRPELKSLDVSGRIGHIRSVLESDSPPERCYPPIEDGKSGNLSLAVGCSYCPFKFDCWQDANDGIGLRTFLYYGGPKHLVHVEREPNVPEVTF